MERFITGNKFKSLADFTFAPSVKRGDDYYNLPNTYDPEKIKNGDIIYTDTGYALEFLEAVKSLDKQIILITHNGDTNIDIAPTDNIIRWYTKNVNIIHPRIESIPIGLENEIWFPERQKKQRILAKLNEPRNYRNLVYMNHSIATNPVPRGRLYQLYESEPWVTSVRGSNGFGHYDEYIDNVYNHKFMICPEGNGIDVHQPWECLYVGTIPIQKRNINNSFYTDLPICFVDNWEDLTEEFLEAEFIRIKACIWNMEKITFKYWENRIK